MRNFYRILLFMVVYLFLSCIASLIVATIAGLELFINFLSGCMFASPILSFLVGYACGEHDTSLRI